MTLTWSKEKGASGRPSRRLLAGDKRTLGTATCDGGYSKMVTIPDWRCCMHQATSNTGHPLNIHFGLAPLISLLAGILILMVPKLLNYIVAFYLIAIGLIGLLGIHQLHLG